MQTTSSEILKKRQLTENKKSAAWTFAFYKVSIETLFLFSEFSSFFV